MTWDIQTDVLVAGYGLSGGVAAVAARDAGAEVLILEKGEYPGGCSIFSGGAVKCADDVEAATSYLSAMSGDRMPAEMICSFAEGLAANEVYVRKLAAVNGAEVGRIQGTGAHYPYPGREALYNLRVYKIPGFTGFAWMRHFLAPSGVNLIKLIVDNVEARRVEVRFKSPVRRLLIDTNGSILGAMAESDGRQIAVRARRAVVLATGGFEQNEWFHKQYLQGRPFYSMAPLTNTGDGIVMAQKAGAALWHMWHIHGSYGFKFPDSPIAYRHPFPGPRNPRRRMAWIVVDRFGSRYMNEYPPAIQDTGHRAMELFDPDIPGYPRIPSYVVFDEEGRKLGAIAEPLAFPGFEYDWSKDNSREIDRGWIVKAGTLAELAEAVKGRFPENEDCMSGAQLQATIEEWNGYVETGEDPLHRPPGTMMRIDGPPFYAAQVWPIITNTQGGPVHNARQQVIDSLGQPIPRLYAVGELGSFFGHLYELGGNLGECVSSGRIAGQGAAAEMPLP
ncbi:MAG: FAD-binding protein [Chloroflexi bacterium]|nr:FAD-binding protein [Chloroflexota bacterium]